MDKFMKIGALALLSLAAVNFTSCKDDDPTFVNPDGPVKEDPKPTPPEEVIPDAPKVEVVVKSISGVVTNAGKNAKAQLQKAADGTAASYEFFYPPNSIIHVFCGKMQPVIGKTGCIFMLIYGRCDHLRLRSVIFMPEVS